MLVGTKCNYWNDADLEVLKTEWLAWMTVCGRAKHGFIPHAMQVLNRSRRNIEWGLEKLVQSGSVPRQKQRATYKPLVLSVADAAWLAGILDGEGSVQIYPHHSSKKNRTSGMSIALVLCHNTDLAIIEKVRLIVPQGTTASTKKNRVRRKPLYRVYASQFGLVRDLITQMLPYMAHTEKRNKAVAVLDYIRNRGW